MRRYWPWVIGFVVGVMLANCGRDPATVNGTALYVVNYFKSGGHIRALLFIGQNEKGNDVFESDFRPNPVSTTDLPVPQKIRILLSPDLGGQKINLSVYAIDEEGELVQFGSAQATAQTGREVEVQINMDPFSVPKSDAGEDAGDEDAGFFDSGTVDSGLPDGGMIRCACPTGCCLPGTSVCAKPTVVGADVDGGPRVSYSFLLTCGRANSFCSGALCEPSHANTCQADGTCSCGGGAPCAAGQRCADFGAKGFACVCDVYSDCRGCCSGASCLVSNLSQTACGAGGGACELCAFTGGGMTTFLTCSQSGSNGGAQLGVCSSSTTCQDCKDAKQCCSGMKCLEAHWPRCRSLNQNVCTACDAIRSDSCSPSAGNCACGAGLPCRSNELCDRQAVGGPRCKQLY
jgi:hypothetical protein